MWVYLNFLECFSIQILVYDVSAGFTEMPVSEEDMMAAKIPLDRRDYCAHKYLELHECKRRHYPFMIKCAHEVHEYNACHVEE